MSQREPFSEPVIDLSAMRSPIAHSPLARRRRDAAALTVLALAAVLTGAAGYAAVRPALGATAPEAVPGPPAAASPSLAAEPPGPPSLLGRAGIPAAAADPARLSPAPRD
ncbi:hypothetical protein [Actinoplanes sp. M2I2]|uniref:hypothetical protein n=1 Tax=Actinoplanes sp. M2I2 TaxID=1734444 RepID=UPI0020228FDD|nr:hypothetical protein [Actinoplanes sp. M2I2]